MTRTRWWLVACGLAVLAGVAGRSSVGTAEAKQAPAAARRVGLGPGYYPPDFSASDLKGVHHTLSAYEGQVVVLHFWASWCPYCRKEIPKLTQVYQQYGGKDVQVLAVSTDQQQEKLQQFLATHQLAYPIIVDAAADPSVADQYGISGIPVTFIIGKDGRIAQRLNGSSDIIGTLQRVLAPAQASDTRT